jgi:pilus assembly protein FimV
MYRRMILASAVSLVLAPAGAEALGLGQLYADSALNQPFLGEIELIDAPVDELDAVKVALASDAEFDKVGAERSFLLTKLRFNPQIAPDGRPVIRVTSREPIREPFLDFLVEVTWPEGRLVREYTVLLDPPVTAERRGRGTVEPASRARRVPPVAAPGGPIAIPDAASGVGFPLYSEPVPAGVGLLEVARRTAPPGATVAQTALALYRSNQDAFIGGDIDRLRVDRTLVIPSAAELFVLDERTAAQQLAAALAGQAVADAPLTQGDDAVVVAADVQGGRLRIAPTDTPAAGAGAERPEDEGPLVTAGVERARQENEELRDRVQALEILVADLQELLVLRDAQLAERQLAQALAAEEVSSAESSSPLGDPDAAPPVQTIAEDPVPPSGATDAPDWDRDAEGPGAPLVAPASEDDAGAAKSLAVDVPPEAASPVADSQPAGPPAAQTAPPLASEADSGSVAWSFVGLGLLALGLLGGAAWYLNRRRRRLADSLLLDAGLDEADSAPADATSGAMHGGIGAARLPEDANPPAQEVPDVAGDKAAEPLPQQSSSLPGLDEETDVDVFSEADIYIAYGRYREAENLLREEIDRSPGRLDLRFKLAEALFGRKDYEGFAALLDKMREAGAEEASPEQWRRLAAMQASLQQGAPEADRGAEPAAGPAAPGEPEPTPGPAPSAGGGEPTPPAVKAATSSRAPRPSEPKPAAARRDPALLDLDLDLDDLVGSVTARDGEDEAEAFGAARPVGAKRPTPLDIDLEDDETLSVGPVDWDDLPVREGQTRRTPRAVDPGGPPGGVGLDLDGDPDDLVIAADDLGRGHGKGDGADAATTDFSFVDDSVADDPLSASWPREDSGPWDEVATKLDLARAYLDMKDYEAARVLLAEIAEEGSDAQRDEARQLLAGLP